jgi:glycosyltransferase involved in cell wall biosynthesis
MPSLYEAQPLVLLEAMAARIPIIGTNVIGVVDHIKDGGIIIEPTMSGIEEGIDRYYHDYALLPTMVERSYRRAEKLRWSHTLKKYEALYEKVLEN